MVVPSTICETDPRSLARTCAAAGCVTPSTAATSVAMRVRRIMSIEEGAQKVAGRIGSLVVPRIDRRADLVQRAVEPVERVCELRLPLTDLAVLRHAIPLETAQKKILVLPLGATAMAPDPVDDVRDLTDLVEHGSRVGFMELLLRQNLGRIDARSRSRMRSPSTDAPRLGTRLSPDGDADECEAKELSAGDVHGV